jgi:hypothetical protein
VRRRHAARAGDHRRPSSYPTEEIGVNARAFRQLGLGYANLGAYSCRTACRTTPTPAAARPPRSPRS